MKIAILDLDDIRNPLLAGGQAHATVEVGKWFVKMGNEFLVISAKYPGYKDRVENGIEYRHIGIATNSNVLNNFIYLLALPFTVSKLKTDIIIECFSPPFSVLFSPLFTKIPVVALPSVFAANQFARKYHLPFQIVESIGCKLYKYFMPYLETDERKMRNYNKAIQSRIITQGVGDEFFKVKNLKSEYILFLGRIDINQKGIDLLIEAYSKIANKIKLPLFIAGHGPVFKKVEELIAKFHMEKRITLLGSTYGRKKLDVLSKAQFVVMPSRYDNLPLFSLEAIASGLPIVTFSTEEFSWIKPRFSIKAKPFSVDELSKAILKMNQRRDILKMRKSARLFAQEYSWKNVAFKMQSFFNYILKYENSTI